MAEAAVPAGAMAAAAIGRAWPRLLAAVTAARLALAALMPLGVDEAYAVAVSRQASLSYFDHPPLVFLLTRLSCDLFGSEAPLVARLPMQLLALVATVLLHDLARVLYGQAAALWAVVLFATAPFFLVMAGAVVPDSPLLVAALLTARLALPLLDAEPGRGWRWLGAGGGLALAALAKYHAVLLVGAGGLVLVATAGGRRWLATPWPWLALALGLGGFLPALWWNAAHGWASFAFQSGRAGSGAGIEWLNAARMAGGQVLYLGPVAALALIAGLIGALRSDLAGAAAGAGRGLAWIGLAMVVPFLLVAPVSRGSLPHWTMAGWCLLLPLAGAWLARAVAGWRRAVGAQAVVVAVVAAAAVAQARGGWLTDGFATLPAFDNTREFSAWDDLGDEMRRIGLAPEGARVAAASWIEAAKVAVALGPRAAVGVVGDDQRHFAHVETAIAARRRPDIVLRVVAPARAEAERAAFATLVRARHPDLTPGPDLALRRGGRRVFLTVLTAAAPPAERGGGPSVGFTDFGGAKLTKGF